MRRRLVSVVSGVALAMVNAACVGTDPAGGRGPEDPVVLGDDLAARADELCSDGINALNNVDWPGDDELTLAGAAPAIAATVDIHRGLIDALSELPESHAEQRAMDELTAAGGSVVAALGELEAASASGDPAAFDRAFAQVTTRAEEAAAVSARLGSTACYAVADG